jgi:choline-sulfatase
MATTPHLLLIQADQLKPQVLGCYGGPAKTPHIDRLAEAGTVFDSAYCNFSLCAPSRFSMLSGMLPSRIGAFDNGAEFFAQTPTVAHYLRLGGYRTTLSGKQHFVGPDMLHGFHERLTPELYPTDFAWTPSWEEVRMESNNDSSGVTKAGTCVRSVQIDHDEAVLYRSKTKLHDYARDDAQPFFLCASFTHPHEPYYCQREHWDRYAAHEVPMPATALMPEGDRLAHTTRMLEHHALLDGTLTDEHIHTARHAYLANVSYFDDMVGELLGALARTGLAENTVVVITSDHGDMLGEHGMWFKKHFLEDCLRVPLIISGAPSPGAGRSAANVSLVDLLPTLAELGGVDANERAPVPLDGQSLVGLCGASTSSFGDRPVLAEHTSEGVPEPMFMVKQGQHKLFTGGGVATSLFDLATDPHERHDIMGQPDSSVVAKRLQAIADETWDTDALSAAIITSQRRRRLVDTAHRDGHRVRWETPASDPIAPWLLRDEGSYNNWAWKGIEDER